MKHHLLFTAAALATSITARADLQNTRLHGEVSAPMLMSATGFQISPDSSTVAFRADFSSFALEKFFLVPITGGTVVQANLNAPGATDGELLSTSASGVFFGDNSLFASITSLSQSGIPKDGIQAASLGTAAFNLSIQPSGSVASLATVPNRSYIAYEYNPAVYTSIRGIKQGESPVSLSPSGVDVSDSAFAPSGGYLVTSGTGGSVAREAVYSTSLDEDGSVTTVALTGSPVIGGGITDFKISEDSNYVAIRGPISASTAEELYVCPINGSGPLTGLVTSPKSVSAYAITPDSTRVVYILDNGSGPDELYVKPIGGGSPVKLNAPLSISATGVVDFAITSDTYRVVYRADVDTAGKTELYSALLDGTDQTKLNNTVSGSVSSFKLSPDGSFAIYRADADAVARHELFHSSVEGGPRTRQHPALGSGRSISSDFAIGSDNHIVFRGDVDGSVGQVRLYVANTASPAITRMDTVSIAQGDVNSFEVAPDGNTIVYMADTTNDESLEVHAAWGAPEVSALADRWGAVGSPVLNQTFSVSDLESAGDDLTVTATSSNPSVVPDSGINVAGIGSSRTISIAPTSGAQGSATITVSVSDGTHITTTSFKVHRYSTEYWSWLSTNFGLVAITNGTLKASEWGPWADPDNDDRPNIVEYALGSFPNSADDPGNPLSIEAVDVSGTLYARVSHAIRHNETLLTYQLRVSTDLATWSTSETGWVDAGAVSTTPTDAFFSKRVRQLTRSNATEPKQFCLLNILWGFDE